MLRDFLDNKVKNYLDDYNENPERERIETQRLINPNFDKEENERFKKELSNIQIIKDEDF